MQSWCALFLLLACSPVELKLTDDVITGVSQLLSQGARIEQTQIISLRRTNRRSRRSIHDNRVSLTLEAFGERLRLRLARNKKLVSKRFLIGGKDSGLNIDTKCYYTGRVVGYRNSSVALSLCDGARGVINFNNESLAISSLPEGSDDIPDAHVVLRLDHNPYLRTVFEDSSNRVLLQALDKDLPRSRLPRSHGQQVSPQSKNRGGQYRQRSSRSALVESAFFVDESLYEHIGKMFPNNPRENVYIFALTLINQLQIAYEQEPLRGMISITLTYLEIMYPQHKELPSNQDFDYYLTAFCIYQQARRNSLETNYTQWDYAVLISAMNMFARNKRGERMNDVVGMTAVGGMCNELHSCAILQGRDLQSAHIIAHEMGHSLGMEHDGEGHNRHCQWNAHIMSATTGLSKKSWSDCSVQSLKNFLQSDRADCLYKRSSQKNILTQPESETLKKFPGMNFTADQQCEMKFGEGYRRSRRQEQGDVCRILKCERKDGSHVILSNAYTAMPGTSCGPKKWCRHKLCTEIPPAEFPHISPTHAPRTGPTATSPPEPAKVLVSGKWTEWTPWGECKSGCAARAGKIPWGIRVSSRKCVDKTTNAALSLEKCSGMNKRFQLCNSTCTPDNIRNLDTYIQNTCIAAMERNASYTGAGSQFFQNQEVYSCRIWCKRDQGFAVSQMGLLPEGSECFYPGEAQNKFCVSGNCMRFSCDGNSLQVSRAPTRAEWNCVAPQMQVPVEPVTTPAAETPRRACRHSCIKGGRGTLFELGCTDCEIDSLGLCDDSRECSKMLSPDEYATTVCESMLRVNGHLFVGVGSQPRYDERAPDRQCRVACRDLQSPRLYVVVDTTGEGHFPAGTLCKADRDSRGYCHYGKCIAESKFEVILHRTTQEKNKVSEFSASSRLRREVLGDVHYVNLSDYLNVNQTSSPGHPNRTDQSNLN